MRPPRRSLEQLHFLGHQQWTEPRGKALNEVLVRIYSSSPMRPTICIIVKLPKMQKLIDRSGIRLEVPDQLLVVAALLERRKANLLIELHRLRHCADSERIGSQFIQGHRTFPPCERFRAAAAVGTDM